MLDANTSLPNALISRAAAKVAQWPYQMISPSGGRGDNHAAYAPDGLQHRFRDLIPTKPYCAEFPIERLLIRGRQTALTYPLLQLNHPSAFRWLTFDVEPNPMTIDRIALKELVEKGSDADLNTPSMSQRDLLRNRGHLKVCAISRGSKRPCSLFGTWL